MSSGKAAEAKKTATPGKKKSAADKKKAPARKAGAKKTTRKSATKKSAPKRTQRSGASGTVAKRLRVRQVRSGVGYAQSFRRTLAALGLKHHQDEVVVPDNPSIRGMIKKVHHLVTVTSEDS